MKETMVSDWFKTAFLPKGWAGLILFICFISLLGNSFFALAQLPVGFVQTPLAEGLDPIRMAIADDGRIFIAEKNGNIRVVKNEILLPDPLITIPVDNFSERGLSGFVLDPDFGTNQFFYVYYTVPGENHNRVSRFKASGDYSDLNTEHVLVNLDTLKGNYHNAGAMIFRGDGKLYVSTGDGGDSYQAQSLNSLMGKILRINPDGSIPEDNPFFDATADQYRMIYALGFRNPFTMAYDPSTGKTLINDVGGSLFEEIDLLEPGKNYGWPLIEGPLNFVSPPPAAPDNYQDPLYSYDRTGGCAIVGGAFYSPSVYSFPEAYHNKFLFGDYCGDYIKVLDPETGEVLNTFVSYVYRPVDIMTAPDGSFYYFSRGGLGGSTDETHSSSNSGVLWKVAYTGNGKPSVFKQPESQLLSVGENCKFNIRASGANPISYQWKKNGIDIENANTDSLIINNVTLDDHGSIYTCMVLNAEGEAMSEEAILNVIANNRPVVSILSPDENVFYSAGDTIVSKGYAEDVEDGMISNDFLNWRIDFHHETHSHPVVESLPGTDSLAFIVPVYGETSPNVWYRIYFTATDEDGLSKTVNRDVLPRKSIITLLTDPPNLKIYLDGQPVSTPSTFESVVNLSRTFGASEVQKGKNYLYVFQNWSKDYAENQLSIQVPSTDSVFTATYFRIPLNDGYGLTGKYFNQDTTFTEPSDFIRIDTTINFNWTIQSPAPPDIGINHFAVQWSGFLSVPQEDVYIFSLLSNDGSRLWINEELTIDNWHPIPGVEKSGSIALLPDKRYKIKIEYYDDDALAFIKLFWSSTLIPKSIVPKNQFSLNTPPVISFLNAYEGHQYGANEQVVMKGSAYDSEDGQLGPHALQWKVNLHDGEHVHLITEATGKDSVLFSTSLGNHPGLDLWWRIYLIAKDSNGEITTDSVDIHPNVVRITINSNVNEVPLTWDGLTLQTPHTLLAIQGTNHTITVPSSLPFPGRNITFEKWEGESLLNTVLFTIPAVDTLLMAHYEIITGDVEPIPAVSIYPNPLTNIFVLKYEGYQKTPMSYKIFSSSGKLVKRNSNFEGTQSIDMSNQPSGIYFLELVRQSNSRLIKILKR